MLKKFVLISLLLFGLAGCSSTYEFTPSTKTEKVSIIDKETSYVKVENEYTSIEITALEREISPWIDPVLKIKIKNNSNIVLPLKSSDVRMGFNNFWFDAYEYEIVREEGNFVNNDNFKMVHELLPDQSITMILKYNAPKSVEYYERKDVLIEVYTSLGLFNVIYKIKKK